MEVKKDFGSVNKDFGLIKKDFSSISLTDNPAEFITFQNRRQTTSLFKLLLLILEEMKDEGVLGDEYFNKLRKEILDLGNSNIRDFEELINKFDIKFRR